MLLYHSLRLTARQKKTFGRCIVERTTATATSATVAAQQTPHMLSDFTCYGPNHEYTIRCTYSLYSRRALGMARNILSHFFHYIHAVMYS